MNQPGMMSYAYNQSTPKREAGERQPSVSVHFHTSLGSTVSSKLSCAIMTNLVSKIITKPNSIWYDSSPQMPNIHNANCRTQEG